MKVGNVDRRNLRLSNRVMFGRVQISPVGLVPLRWKGATDTTYKYSFRLFTAVLGKTNDETLGNPEKGN